MIFDNLFPRNLYSSNWLNERLKFLIFPLHFRRNFFCRKNVPLSVWFLVHRKLWYFQKYTKKLYPLSKCLNNFFAWNKATEFRLFFIYTYIQCRVFSFFFSIRKILILLSKYSNNFSYVKFYNLPNISTT